MDPDLENYRKRAISVLKQNASFIRDAAKDALGLPVKGTYIIGSVLDKDRFSENSDVDVAVVVADPSEQGLSERLSSRFQNEMIRYPLGDVGVVNTVVFANKLAARGKTLKIGMATKVRSSKSVAAAHVAASVSLPPGTSRG